MTIYITVFTEKYEFSYAIFFISHNITQNMYFSTDSLSMKFLGRMKPTFTWALPNKYHPVGLIS